MKKLNITALVRMLSFGLACLMLAGCIGCSGTGDDDGQDSGNAESTEAKPENVEIVVYDGQKSLYNIIRPENADDALRATASSFNLSMRDVVGSKASLIYDDWVKGGGKVENEDCEILLGATNRVQSDTAAKLIPGYLDYVIAVIDNKICLVANDSERLGDACDAFVKSLEKREGGSIVYKGLSIVVGNYEYPLVDATVGEKKLVDCKIVVSAAAEETEKNLAETMAIFLAQQTGVKPPVVTDSESTPDGAEIVIGNTNRREVPSELNDTQYAITLAGSSLFVQAKSSSALSCAHVELEELLKKKDALTEDFTKTYEAGLSLQGKKVMFIGNSMIYYGNCVITGDQNVPDKGYFYQLCKANGENCMVTDCTFGSHGLREFIGKCDSDHHGVDHLSSYNLSQYDYVIMCQVTEKDGLTAICKQIMKRFTNPKTKFIYLCCTYTYQQNHQSVIRQLPDMQAAGITVVNFGELCYNVWKGNTKVPGSSLDYNKESFIINAKDANHPNMLTGYIEALMCYCAITGKSAVGQPYKFCTDTSISSSFNMKSFISSHYTNKPTNMDKIFASEADMLGLQQLIDQTNKKWGADTGIPQ